MAVRKKRSPARGRKTSGRKPRTRKGRRRQKKTRGWWKLGLGLLVLFGLLMGAYSVYLGKTVRVKFEGKRWAAPARIYARPLELYAGASVSAAQLKAELEFLGYRNVAKVSGPAQWSQRGGRFTVYTRDFAFWDGSEPGRALSVDTNASGVTRIRSGTKGVDLLRLEPALVGSIYPSHNEDRVLVQRADLPDDLVNGLLAIEDRRFFEHGGVDVRGIARALWANIQAGRTVQGGSTLTKQLVKNFVLTPERSLWRKVNEALMALIVDARYGKDEILEAYANEIFLGQEGGRAIHGFGLGAHFYFNRPLRELRLHESALLVGLVKGASYYNPRRNPERALERRNLVIDQMQAQGFITQAEAGKARQQKLGISAGGAANGHRVPAFVDLVRRQLRRDYREEDLTSEGLRIFTTLDPWVQQRAASALSSRLQKIEQGRRIAKGSLQGAMVVVSAQNGEVQALVGGRDAGFAGFNRALDAVRPIGSLVKPAVYLAALSMPERYTLSTLIEDKAVDMTLRGGQRWQPRNYDHQLHGEVPLHEALAKSFNLATVNMGMDVGLKRVVSTLRALGVKRDIDAYPSLLLGALSLSPLEVAQVYQSLAAGGFNSPLRAIRAVLDDEQEQLQRYPLTVDQAADPAAVFLLTRNLVEVAESGTGAGLRNLLPQGLQVAGKTGTTNELRDSWFAGFSADRVAVAWVGRDDNAPTGLTGSQGAMPVWADLMRSIDNLSLQMVPPPGIEYHWVDRAGRLSAETCEGAVAFPYIAGSQPLERSDCTGQQGLGGFLEGLFN
ncbi:MAG: penicillin-binding protein 1B [Gammaproteobacteria bacterium]|nr:penicillin-binding protein 1B [Gammaproteobacteria bacterium]